MNSIRSKNIGNRGNFSEVIGGQNLRVGVDVVESRSADSNARIRACVIAQTWVDFARQFAPVPQRLSRVAALDAAIEIVPMVEHAKLQMRALAYIERGNGLQRLNQTQKIERAVERADIVARRDNRNRMAFEAGRTNHEPFRSERGKLSIPSQRGYVSGRLRRSGDDDSIAFEAVRQKHLVAQKPCTAGYQFRANGFHCQ